MAGAAKSARRPPQFAKGTEVRSRRAALKRGMKEGSIDWHGVLAGTVDDEHQKTAADMPLESLLLAVPGVGDTTAHDLLELRGIPASARLWALTDERRRELADAVRKAIA